MSPSPDTSPTVWLESWYRQQCDGDWEHQYGIRISTLDNPGWALDIDLGETECAGKKVLKKLVERNEENWVFVEVENDIFRARGGPTNLSELIGLFRSFVEGRSGL